MFTPNDIAHYYDSTQVHYERWWNLKESQSLHYGIWTKETRSFSDALRNTNEIMAHISAIAENEKVLDAGCGIGGSAFYISKTKNAQVVGISLSEKQIKTANTLKLKLNFNNVFFEVMDFTQTSFENNAFDVVWACESMCHACNQSDFIKEAFRILKKGGRLIVADYFVTPKNQSDKNRWVKKWNDAWCIPNITSSEHFVEALARCGFTEVAVHNYTREIYKSSKRMLYASLMGALPSVVYNLFHPNVSAHARNHFKSGYYQFQALRKKLWQYHLVQAKK